MRFRVGRSRTRHKIQALSEGGEELLSAGCIAAMAADGAGLVKRAAIGAPETQPWVEKFRPKTLNDVAAHNDIIDTSAPVLPAEPLQHANCLPIAMGRQ